MNQKTKERLEYWGLITAIALGCFSIFMAYMAKQ